MLRNYFKVAVRNLFKNKFYTLINILGLTIGIASALLIIIYISDELSYDRFHENHEQLYRVNLHGRLAGQEFKTNTTPVPMSEALVREYPEILNSIRLNTWGNTALRNGERSFTEDYILAADSNFFEFFSFELLKGNAKKVLNQPNQLVLTESAVEKYFGTEDPIGKSLQLGTEGDSYEVTGVAANPPENSHFHFEVIVSFVSDRYAIEENASAWTNNSYYTYIELDEKADWKETEKKLDALVIKYVGPEIERYIGATIEQFREKGGIYGYFLRPIADIHLSRDIQDEIEPSGDMSNIYAFGVIGFLIILIACINFMNISTAKSSERAKEVGIRKTIGAVRERLIGQFLSETVLLAVISTLTAILVIILVLPLFNTFSGKELSLDILKSPIIFGSIVMITLLIGVLAGSYPAFYLTAFRPSEVLKGRLKSGVKSGRVRSSLVVVQFSISIFLIVSTLIIYNQMTFMRKKNMGFDKENVLVINNARSLGDNYSGFRNDLLSYQFISDMSRSNFVPPHLYNTSAFKPEGAIESEYLLTYYNVDEYHLETLGFEMKEGRFFSEDFPSDTSAIILNESAVKSFGWEEALNKNVFSFFDSEDGRPLKVVGVVKDFNFESLRHDIRPMAMILGRRGNRISLRLGQGDVMEQVSKVEETWKKYVETSAFDYSFVDADFDALFKTERKMGEIYILLTVLAIVIACVGLFGLATFMAEQRTKEIGIRKVMGASVKDITILLSKEFTKLVLISFIIGSVISYFMMNRWLEGFAYRINPGVLSFILSGIGSLLIAWLTVSYQSIRAALANPTDALRSE